MADPPAWAPTLTQIAAYIPTRTSDTSVPGSDVLAGTFTDNTSPTKAAVEATFIPGAVVEVTAACPTIPAALTGLASEAAALRAAADIELAYPDRDADVEVYRDLDARAKAALARLVEAVGDSGAGPDALLPVWQMPDPVWYGDTNL